MICPRGCVDPGDSALCAQCGEFLRRAPAAPPPQSTHSPAGAGSGPGPMVCCTEPDCDLELLDGECLVHGAAPTRRPSETSDRQTLSVRFPWGTLPVSDVPLVVGRSTAEAGRFAECLREYGRWAGHDYGNLSRVHAVIWSDPTGSWIRHVGRTNITTLNGGDLVPNEATRLRAGDVLRFAKGLTASVVPTAPP
ncbi:FHA domain-containing protein [Streptomyces populi]